VNLTLLRQDPVLTTFRITILLPIFMGLLLRFILSQMPQELGLDAPARLDVGAMILSICAILLWLFLLVASGYWMRCRRLDLSLPLSPRRLWLSRSVMVVAGWLLPLAIFTMILALRFPAAGRPFLDIGTLTWGSHQAAWLLLLTVCLQLPSPRLQQQKIDSWYVVYSSVLAAAVLMAILFTRPWTALIVSVFGAAMLLYAWLFLRLPNRFILVSARLEDGADPEPLTGDAHRAADHGNLGELPRDTPAAARWLRFRVITRMVTNNPLHWLIFPTVLFYSWAVIEAYHEGRTVMPYLLFILVWCWALLAYSLPRVQRFDHLPIPRRALLPFGIVPFLLLIGVGAMLWGATQAINPGGAQIRFYDEELHVPPEFWERAPNGEAELVTAPWGESHRPEVKRLVAGWSMAVYNPYTWGEKSSDRFAAWQVARARAAVYGEPDPAELASAWQPDAKVVDCLDCKRWSSGRGLDSPLRSRCLALGSSFMILFGTFFVAMSLPANRARGPRRLFMVFVPATTVLLVLAATLVLLGDILGWAELEFMEVFLPTVLRGWVEALPAALTTPWLWAMNALLTAGCYALILRIFHAIELPMPKRIFLVEYES